MKKIYLVCATGIATSTMLRVKIQEFLEEKGLSANITQYRVAELSPDRIDADLIVATTTISDDIKEKVPFINGLPLITGIGEDEVLASIQKVLTNN